MNTKNILLSKTLWVQVLAILIALVPAVQLWLAANPVEFVAVLAAVNVIVRFVTSGKISIFAEGNNGADQDNGGNTLLGFVLAGAIGLGTAAGLGGLSSCSSGQIESARKIPIKACWVTSKGTVCYSSKGGLEVEVDQTSGK